MLPYARHRGIRGRPEQHPPRRRRMAPPRLMGVRAMALPPGVHKFIWRLRYAQAWCQSNMRGEHYFSSEADFCAACHRREENLWRWEEQQRRGGH